jgi:hypothetical protein
MMTSEEIMMKLAQITGKNNEKTNIASSQSTSEDNGDRTESTDEPISAPSESEEQVVTNDAPIEVRSPELDALCTKWSANLGISGALISNQIIMNRKDYLKHTKSITQDELLEDPLLYVLFRSEDQSEVNFFNWINKFPKVKNESK